MDRNNELEKILGNILNENSMELGVSSNYFSNVIENNATIDYELQNDKFNHFFINNNDMKIYDSKTLLLINICNCKNDYMTFENYLNVVDDEITKELKLYLEYRSNLILDDNNLNLLVNKVDVLVYLVVRNFEEMIKVKNRFSRPTKKTVSGVTFTINITGRNIPLSNSINEEIRIDSRIESVKFKNSNEDKSEETEGYVFTANLFDVTKLYKNIGHDLFISNLRIGIGDQNKVDESIKYTLLNDHQNFWYYNNGITLIAKKESLDLKHPEKIILKYNKIKDFTIVNGAQTINSAANIFYSENAEFKKNEDTIINNAKVILRIIVIPDKKQNEKKKIENQYSDIVSKISIALNRQKPITEEDIAYFVPFVEAINYLYKRNIDNEYFFSIVRRGEGEYLGSREYELLTIARIIKAYLGVAPGPARNSGKKTLLDTKIKNIENSDREFVYFKQEDVFVEQEVLMNDDENDELNKNDDDSFNLDNNLGDEQLLKYEPVFIKYYKPVNYGVRLKYILDKINIKKLNTIDINDVTIDRLKIKNSFQISEEKNKIFYETALKVTSDDVAKTINYGKYQLITFIIHALSGFEQLKINNDFSKWSTPDKNINSECELIRCAEMFAIAWKFAYFTLNITNSKKNFEEELDVLKANVFESNNFKLSKLNERDLEKNHLALSYKYFLILFKNIKSKKK